MTPALLLPETVARQDGTGAVFSLGTSGSPWLLTLNITRILEQESLEVVISGSPDCEHWLPLAVFPRKFYCGTYGHWLDLSAHPGVQYLRAEWKMSRWGPTENNVLCAFSVAAEHALDHARVLHAGAR